MHEVFGLRAPRGVRVLSAVLCLVLGAGWAEAGSPPVAKLEAWYQFDFHGKKVGFLHAVDEPTTYGGKQAIHTLRRSQIVVRRQEHVIRMEAETDSWCDLEGRPLKFKHSRLEGGNRRSIEGAPDGKGGFTIRVDVGGALTQKTIPLGKEVYLAHTLDVLFRRDLAPGRSMKGSAIVEDDGDVQPFSILVKGKKPHAAGTVYEVESTIGELSSIELVLETGVMIESSSPRLGATFTKTTREQALAPSEPQDIFTAARLSSHARLPQGDLMDRLDVRMTGRSGRAPKPIEDHRQKTRKLAGATVELQLFAESAPQKSPQLPIPVPKELTAFLAETPYEATGDERLRKTAKEVTTGARDAWSAAKRINAFVHGHIKNKSLAQAFSTANEALEAREGDCTEHAVLFSALAKIVGIPTRLVTGLVYVGGEDGGFGYHEWVEVWMAGRWVGMDPTFGQDVVDPTHIKFTQGLSDPKGLREAGVVAAELFGDIRLEVLRYKNLDGSTVIEHR